MSSIRDRARITVKIHNMKRSASRAPGTERGDSPPPRVKRIRTSMDRYDHHVPDSRQSPDRRRLRSQSVHPRYVTPSHSTHRDEFALAVIPREPCEPPPISERGHTFKVLCISSLHPKASDEYVKETLYREFKRFGDFSIRIGREHDERLGKWILKFIFFGELFFSKQNISSFFSLRVLSIIGCGSRSEKTETTDRPLRQVRHDNRCVRTSRTKIQTAINFTGI